MATKKDMYGDYGPQKTEYMEYKGSTQGNGAAADQLNHLAKLGWKPIMCHMFDERGQWEIQYISVLERKLI